MDYPCTCPNMKWLMDNYRVFIWQEDRWMLTWKELDKTKKGVNIENFGVTANHCMFCGEKIKNIGG